MPKIAHIQTNQSATDEVAAATGKQKPKVDDADALDLESLYATTKVHAKLKNGAIADADELRVTTKNEKQNIELRGQPTAMA